MLCVFQGSLKAQTGTQQNNSTPYGRTSPTEVKKVMDRVRNYIEQVTPGSIIDGRTGENIRDLRKPSKDATLAKTEYNMTSHEWGLVYTAMLHAEATTGDRLFKEYVSNRFLFLGSAAEYFRANKVAFPQLVSPLEHFLFPQSLDDTGSMCASMIQAQRLGITNELKTEIDRSIEFILTKVIRLKDGTFARNRPLPNSVWVDDLYQGIPALAQMGKLTGDHKYYNEAVGQVLAFAGLLFDKSKGISMHGWVEGMDPNPAFYWARANGWAILAVSALLDVLPEHHPQHKQVLELFKAYCEGIAAKQSFTGFWHQLLDRNDSFLETSATAMFTYAFAHGINEGWLDLSAYGPVALLGWNAVSTKVNEKGLVEGTSAGTSMAFDAAYYYQRPVGTGPHGYGSVLIAGAAMYKLLSEHPYESNGPVFFKR